MNAVGGEGALQPLARALALRCQEAQEGLAAEVKCGIKASQLVVVVEHPAPRSPHSADLFARLEQEIRERQSLFLGSESSGAPVAQAQLYLRVIGQPPYARHLVQLEADPTVNPVTVNPVLEGESEEELEEAIAPPPPPEPTSDLTVCSPIQTAEDWSEASSALMEIADEPEPTPDPVNWEKWDWLSQLPGPFWLAGIAVSLFTFTGTVYALTRPCVIGGCPPLQTAQSLYRSSSQLTQSELTSAAIVEAYEQLVEAGYLLNTIPPWSSYYSTAQSLVPLYEAESRTVGKVVKAQESAMAAANASQNPPHPLETWQDIQGLWRNAIAQLEQIPEDSVVSSFTRTKLSEYQGNLAAINRRITVEQEAQEKILTARTTAQLAETREAIAESVEGWQLAHATWQATVKTLQSVLRNTMAHAEAQQLLAIYEPKLAMARDRRTQEEISATAYNRALSLAAQAQTLEQREQWAQAVSSWQEALTNAEQVPTGTSYHGQAQPLVGAYRAALNQAQDSLRFSVAMQSAMADLSRTCSGGPSICDYTLGDKVIKVQIRPTYDQVVERTMVSTGLVGDYNTPAEVLVHANTLLRALAAISENAQVPIELYYSDGSQFGTYMPEFSGYVPRR